MELSHCGNKAEGFSDNMIRPKYPFIKLSQDQTQAMMKCADWQLTKAVLNYRDLKAIGIAWWLISDLTNEFISATGS